MNAIGVQPPVLIDNRDCAFPKAVVLGDGRILCSYGVGGGPEVWGGTDWAWSDDGARAWHPGGTVLAGRTGDNRLIVSNALKLSRSADGATLFAYGSRFYRTKGAQFGMGKDEAVLCTSHDDGQSWSDARVLPFDYDFPLEISDGLLVVPDGRLLAPAGLLPAKDRLGERVVALISDDGGETWRRQTTVFEHPEHRHGYFEHKFTVMPNGDLLAISWTVTLDTALVDQPNHVVRSADGGDTWSNPCSTGLRGQTMCAVPMDDETLLVAYNRRYGAQGVVLALVHVAREPWTVLAEAVAYDAQAQLNEGDAGEGVETFDAFRFGFPQLLPLPDASFLLTYWAMPGGTGHYGVYASRVTLDQMPG